MADDDAGKITKLITDKEADFHSRWERMDRSFKTWAEETSDYDRAIDTQTKRHGSDIEIISPDLRTNCDDVQSILSSSERQIRVTMAESAGEDKKDDIGKLERLFEFLLLKADERLIRMLLPPLKESLIWYSLLRGWTAGRFLTSKDGDDVIPNYQALDPRWLVYEVGQDGLLLTGYTTMRAKAALESQYGKEIKDKGWWQFWKESQRTVKVRDIWKYEGKNSITNSVVCNNTFLIKEEEYKLSSIPILIMPITTRPPGATPEGDDDMEGYGEDIFAPVRDINGQRNRFLSMVASHANLMANQALINYKGDGGKSIPPGGMMNVPGGVVELVLNQNDLQPSPMQEISPTVLGILDILTNSVRNGLLPDIDIKSPPQSGTLQGQILERGDKIFNPQLRNLNYFYADICRLIEEQMIADGISITIQGENKRKFYEVDVTPVDLKKSHVIQVTHTARTPWQRLEVAQQADMLLRQGFSFQWVLENVYKVQDPKGLQDMGAVETATNSPIQVLITAIKKLYAEDDEGSRERADILVQELRAMIEQQIAPQEEQSTEQPTGGQPL